MAGFDNDVVFAQVGCDIGAHPNTSGAESSVEFTKAGGTVTQVIQNISNTGASQTTQLIKVGGSSAGDVWTQFSIGSTTSWALGADNSSTDNLKFTKADSGTIDPSSGTTYIEFFKTPSFGFVPSVYFPSNFIMQSFTEVGGTVALYAKNDDENNGASNALVSARVGAQDGVNSGDPYFVCTVEAQTNAVFGIDNSDADSLYIRLGTGSITPSAGGSVAMKVVSGGICTFPNTPSFLVTHTVAQNDVTGNNVQVTVNYTTIISNIGSDYDGTNTYTAPVSGFYLFVFSVRTAELAATATSAIFGIGTSNRGYVNSANWGVMRTVSNNLSLNMSAFADVDAGDIAISFINVAGMPGNTVDLPATPDETKFAGTLLF